MIDPLLRQEVVDAADPVTVPNENLGGLDDGFVAGAAAVMVQVDDAVLE
jgi:hypothetical protein